jgi:hypothetical protein
MKRVLPFLLLGGMLVLAWWWLRRPSPDAPSVSSERAVAASARSAPAVVAAPIAPVARAEESAPTSDLAAQITRALNSGSAAERDHALDVLLPRLVATDPAAAGHLALAWEAGLLREELLSRVIRNWAEQDIGGALTWLTSLLDSADRSLASVASTKQVARTDPSGALDLALALRVGLDDGSFERMAQLWAEEHPADAVNWAVNQPHGPVRDRLLARVAHVRAQQEPAEAARLVFDHMAPGTARDAAILAVVRQWALRDHAGAALWVDQFPAGALRAQAVGELDTARKLVR